MPVHTLILGHSICKWLMRHIQSECDDRFKLSLGLSRISTISFYGIGGLNVNRLLLQHMRVLDAQLPQCVVLLVGGNDVTFDCSAEEIAYRILSFCTVLTNRHKVKQIMLCQLLPRYYKHGKTLTSQLVQNDKTYKDMYYTKAMKVNEILLSEMSGDKFFNIKFWQHCKFQFDTVNGRDLFGPDGVHLNAKALGCRNGHRCRPVGAMFLRKDPDVSRELRLQHHHLKQKRLRLRHHHLKQNRLSLR
ncbi:uncharacterized protein LOC121376968 isoform X1 [Gigantopelta aegis]|uniref:uncharacterized protein LOC121376968 isoform X1 n=1 Tax=Gigantopelta aegis TaxID=1735272 RepID=UPI001B88E367|nr:uncharacterized protein LOC121376968 isoform X1 [Gigantopelta aegis]